MKLLSLTLLVLILNVSCGKVDKRAASGTTDISMSELYSATEIKVFVFYEEGAEPYVQDALPLKYWTLLQKNIAALFQGKLPESSISVPTELSQMSKLSAQNKATWSTQEVFNLAKTLGEFPVGNFVVMFLKGYSDQGQGIIGFQITGTNVIAVFKDVVKSTGAETNLVTRYMEQATLIHEMGHALGLVNNGVPMTSNHHDADHGAHCTNPNCIMSYSNEGRSAMLNFVENIRTNGTIIMYDQACLNDAQSFLTPKKKSYSPF
jgi:predicted Zn-dependent protease